jgi:hypothetical protein
VTSLTGSGVLIEQIWLSLIVINNKVESNLAQKLFPDLTLSYIEIFYKL